MSQIVVSKNAGIIDTVTAALRYVVVIMGAVPLLLKMLGAGNFAAIVGYFQTADGSALIAAIGALGTLAYGLVKTFRRGDEVASVASSSKVPNSVAMLK